MLKRNAVRMQPALHLVSTRVPQQFIGCIFSVLEFLRFFARRKGYVLVDLSHMLVYVLIRGLNRRLVTVPQRSVKSCKPLTVDTRDHTEPTKKDPRLR